MYWQEITEGQPRRNTDPAVAIWLKSAYARPDANKLYLHGSNQRFEQFRDPAYVGNLIHFTKLLGENWAAGAPLQAEYYGANLYLVTIHAKKPFRPYSDPQAKAILADGLRRNKVWDYEQKIKYGRLDYQDQHEVVPQAVAAGYDLFRIYECSIQGDSIGVTRGDMITIVDRYPAV